MSKNHVDHDGAELLLEAVQNITPAEQRAAVADAFDGSRKARTAIAAHRAAKGAKHGPLATQEKQ